MAYPLLYNGPPLLPQNCPFPWEDLDHHVIHGSLGPAESTTQTACQLVQLLLQSSRSWQTHHATAPVTIGHIYEQSTAMPTNNKWLAATETTSLPWQCDIWRTVSAAQCVPHTLSTDDHEHGLQTGYDQSLLMVTGDTTTRHRGYDSTLCHPVYVSRV